MFSDYSPGGVGGRRCGYPLIRLPVVDGTGTLLVAPGEKGRTGRATHRRVSMEVSESHSFPRHALNSRRIDPTIVKLQVAATEVVRKDDNDVWRLGARAEGG